MLYILEPAREKLKEMEEDTLYFDDTKETVLNVDASIKGLGAVIVQKGKPVAFGSKTLTTGEKRYANIERELLTIVWGAQKIHTYVYGRRVIVEKDHKPLEPIFRRPLIMPLLGYKGCY